MSAKRYSTNDGRLYQNRSTESIAPGLVAQLAELLNLGDCTCMFCQRSPEFVSFDPFIHLLHLHSVTSSMINPFSLHSHQQDGCAPSPENAIGYTAQCPPRQARPAVRAHGDQIHVVGLRIVDDAVCH